MHKTNKIISLLLAMIMVFGMIPLNAFAEETTPIEINRITVDFGDNTIEPGFITPDDINLLGSYCDSNYNTVDYEDAIESYGLNWQRNKSTISIEDDSWENANNTTFEDNTAYLVTLTVQLKDGYVFVNSSENRIDMLLSGNANAEAIEDIFHFGASDDGMEAIGELVYMFGNFEPEDNRIELNGITASIKNPVAEELPAPTTESYVLLPDFIAGSDVTVTWYKNIEITEFDAFEPDSLWIPMQEGELFEIGLAYAVSIKYTLPEEYKLAENLSMTLNDIDLINSEYRIVGGDDANPQITIYMSMVYAPLTPVIPPLSRVDISLVAPVFGDALSNTLDIQNIKFDDNDVTPVIVATSWYKNLTTGDTQDANWTECTIADETAWYAVELMLYLDETQSIDEETVVTVNGTAVDCVKLENNEYKLMPVWKLEEPQKEVITEFNAVVTAPVIGEYATSQLASFSTNFDESAISDNAITWLECAKDAEPKEWTIMNTEEPFKANTQYLARVQAFVGEGYVFSENITLTLNDKTPNSAEVHPDNIAMEFAFDTLVEDPPIVPGQDDKVLKSISVTIDEPVYGVQPSLNIKTLAANPMDAVSVDGQNLVLVQWSYNTETKSLEDDVLESWIEVKEGERFVEDRYYALAVLIGVKEEYKLADDFIFIINGQNAKVITKEGLPLVTGAISYDKLEKPADIEDPEPAKLIEKITLKAPNIKIGDKIEDPTIEVTPADSTNFTVKWNKTKGENNDFTSNWEEVGETFEEGYCYILSVEATKASDAYFLSNNTETEVDRSLNPDLMSCGSIYFNGTVGFTLTYNRLEKGYSIIENANGTWKDNSTEKYSVRSDAPYSKFKSVKVDDIMLFSSEYETAEGSTIVTLTTEFLKTLKPGSHKLDIIFEDGTASTTFTVEHVHVLTKVEKTANCTEKGVDEHYECKCGKWFTDEDAQKEVVDKSTLDLEPTGHKAEDKWSFDGNQHWHKCSVCKEPADEKADHEYEADVTNSDGTVTKGHVCKICQYDKDNPKTGDMTPITVISIVMLATLFGMITIIKKEKKI